MFQTYPTHKVTDQYRALAREVEGRLDAIEKGTPWQPVQSAVLKEAANG